MSLHRCLAVFVVGYCLLFVDVGFVALRSEPISVGIQKETEKDMMGHVTRERFQSILDSQVSMRTRLTGGLSLRLVIDWPS